MVMAMCLTFFIFLNIQLVRGLTYTSVIKTASGPVRGSILNTIENVDYAAFKGIPYAKPPVDNLRFKPPVEVDTWADVYNATSDGNICTQFNSTSKSVVGLEDCLYINVFTPHTEFSGSISKPVMVWIYGGGFVDGYSNQFLYGPDFILGEDVIMVSFNYRVSVLGFLNLEHENATGNCGLKDQNLALKWVQRNIAQFGGNPDNVTIFGQSAGSMSVDLHVLSDMSVGLFSQSISMSGSLLGLYRDIKTGAEAVRNAFILGSKLGTDTTSKDTLLETLYNTSAADIIVAASDIQFTPFKPSFEKIDIATDQEKFFTECPLNKYINGNYTKGPYMMGFAANETVSIAGVFEDLLKITESTLESLGSASSYQSRMSELTDDSMYKLIEETTDIFFILGIDAKHKLISRNNNYPIYYYRFSFDSNYSLHKTAGINLDGAGHGDELPYIFYMPAAGLPLNQSDIATTRQRFVKLWTNFVKYGNPTPGGKDDKVLGITWLDSRSNGEHLEIGKVLTTGPRPVSHFVKILQVFGLGSSLPLKDCTNNKYSSTQ